MTIKDKTYGYQIPQGQHNIEISARWSNAFEDSTQLPLDVKEGRKYTFHTHELQEGQDPNAPVDLTMEYKDYGGGRKRVGNFFKENAGAFLFIAGVSYPPLGLAILTVGMVQGAYRDMQRSPQIKGANTGPQDNTANTEAQPTDSVAEA